MSKYEIRSRYEIRPPQSEGIAEIVLFDRMLPSTVLPAIKALKQRDYYPSLKGVVWDLRGADLSEMTIAMFSEIFITQKTIKPTTHLRVACLISSSTDAHILKLWAAGFHDSDPHVRRWFLDADDAWNWLRRGGA